MISSNIADLGLFSSRLITSAFTVERHLILPLKCDVRQPTVQCWGATGENTVITTGKIRPLPNLQLINTTRHQLVIPSLGKCICIRPFVAIVIVTINLIFSSLRSTAGQGLTYLFSITVVLQYMNPTFLDSSNFSFSESCLPYF